MPLTASTNNALWLDSQVSYYPGGHSDTSSGVILTLREILLCEFIYSFPTIMALKKLNREDADYEAKKRKLKNQLAAYALNVLESRRGRVLSYSGLMQFDWDYEQ